MSVNRRDFLKKGLLAAGVAAAGTVGVKAIEGAVQDNGPTTTALTPDLKLIDIQNGKASAHPLDISNARQGIPGRRWVMVIDLAKCDGCGKCTAACAKMHFIPPDRQWIKVLRMQDAATTAPYFFPQPCYHCDNPPCTKVCPVNATFKRSDGIVLIDNERCIGCRFCIAACPYGSRHFNWTVPHNTPAEEAKGYSPEWGYPRRVGTVEKCDFCPDMAGQGKLPGCVAGCPMGALYYGDENEDAATNSAGETHRFSQLLLDRAGSRYLEELGTKPRVYYLPPKNRMYPSPAPQKGNTSL